MTVTVSSGSSSVSPQLYDTVPLSSLRQAEQQDRFPDRTELDRLINFFQAGQSRIAIAQLIAVNADRMIARAANRIFSGGTPLAYLDEPASQTAAVPGVGVTAAEAPGERQEQVAFDRSVRTYSTSTSNVGFGGWLGRLLANVRQSADVAVVTPAAFSPIDISRYGNTSMRKSLRDLGWFLRYVGYAVVAGDPSILVVNARGLREVLVKGCSIPATLVALQEMRAEAAELFSDRPDSRALVIDCFNVLIKELSASTPSARQRPGSKVAQGLQLPASYAEAAGSVGRYVMRPGLSGREKAEVIRAAYRQVLERDVVKGYSLRLGDAESCVANGSISMREFVRRLGQSEIYRRDFYGSQSNSRAVELAFRHFLGRGVSTLEEFRRYFAIISTDGLAKLVDALVDSAEYGRIYGEETVPYLRDLGEEAQESANWGPNRKLFTYAARFQGAPQYITSFAGQRQPLPDQHVYGGANDPVANRYGAIFPSPSSARKTFAAGFGYDTRRLLVGTVPGLRTQVGLPPSRPSRAGSSGVRVVRLQQVATGGSAVPRRAGRPSVRFTEASTQAVIAAVYAQVLGNRGYDGERLSSEEARLENGDICLKDFVRCVARSQAFRRRYWEGLYIVKAIEVMHRRLLGRPSYGRWEIDTYFDVASKCGFYGLVDALIDSREYADAFGDDTVPYERYITPADRVARQIPGLRPDFHIPFVGDPTNRPLVGRRPERRPALGFNYGGELPRRRRDRVQPSLLRPSLAAVAPSFSRLLAPRTEPIRLVNRKDPDELSLVIRSSYRQVLGKLQPMEAERLSRTESELAHGTITVRQFVRAIALSDLYRRRYYEVCSPQAFVEFNFSHLLGRPPSGQAEINQHLQLLAEEGLKAEIDSYLASEEYVERFGEDIVPYSIESRVPQSYQRPRPQLSFASLDAAPVVSAPVVADAPDAEAAPRWTAKIGRAPAPSYLSRVPARNLSANLLYVPAIGAVVQRRREQPVRLSLSPNADESELQVVICAAYKQLLGRVPLANERLRSAESQLRSRAITVADFIARVSASSLFQNRLSSMPAFKAADAVFMALQGRAPSPEDTRAFAVQRATRGQTNAVAAILETPEYKERFGANTVPTVEGMQTYPGRYQQVVSRTSELDGGAAGITPRP